MADYNRNQGGSNRGSNQEWNENRGRNNRNQDNDQNWNSGNENWNSGNQGYGNSDWDQSRLQSRHQRDEYGRGSGNSGMYSSGRYGRHWESDFNSGNYGNDRSSGYASYYGSDSGMGMGSGSSYGPGSSGDSYGTQGYNSGSQYGSGNYGSGSYGSGSGYNRDRNLYDRDYQGMGRGGYSNSGTRLGGSNYGGSYGDRDRSYYRGNDNNGSNWGNMSQRDRDNDRNWWDRATDEVSSWFGDDDAERRRERDRQMSHRGKGPKNYNRSDDRIKEDINDKLSDDPFIDASEIDVTVSNGDVTLTGTVDHRSTKRRAEDLAEAISGVKNVENRIRVGSMRSDSSSGTTGTTSGSTTGTESTSTAAVPGSDRSRTTKRDYVTG